MFIFKVFLAWYWTLLFLFVVSSSLLHAGIDIFAKVEIIREFLFARFKRDVPCNDESGKKETENDLNVIAKICTMSVANNVSESSPTEPVTTFSRTTSAETCGLDKDNKNVSDETSHEIRTGKLNPEAPGFDGSKPFHKTPDTSVHLKES